MSQLGGRPPQVTFGQRVARENMRDSRRLGLSSAVRLGLMACAAMAVCAGSPAWARGPAKVKTAATKTTPTRSTPPSTDRAPSPATALPSAATPVTAVPLPVASTPATKPATELPGAPTQVTATGRRTPTPVATASTLPPVPQEKLRSDVYTAPIALLISQGKFGDALQEVDLLLARNPHDDELLAKRARLLYWLDRRQSARETLDDVRSRHPMDPELRELDAQMRLAEGDTEGALREYRLLEMSGDGRPEVHQRVIDLALERDEHEIVTASLKAGGQLTDEQAKKYVKMAHPWFADAAFTGTFYRSTFWPRVDAHIGHTINKRWSVLAGGIWEQRESAEGIDRAWAPKAEVYGGVGIVDGMLHFEGSPSRTFLPVFDARADLAASVVKWFSLGLYARFAYYKPLASRQELPTRAWTLAPNVIFYVNEWTLQAGYMFIDVPNTPSDTQIFHTGFLKARWEPHPFWTAFAWLYMGTDPTFVERYGVKSPTGATLVLGGEHWWTPRFGTRLSASRTQPFDSANAPYTDFTIVLRGRL